MTVLVPCFNDGALIRETLDSIHGDEQFEIVIVDDASTDPTTSRMLEQLEGEGYTVIGRTQNGGAAAARETGLQATSARFVYPLDADDLTVAGAISRMADKLDAHPEAAVCFGDYEEFGDSDYVRPVPEALDPYRVAYTNEFPVSSLFRRSVLEGMGGWHADGFKERSHEDWNVWMALVERGLSGVHVGPGQITYRRRLHGGRVLTWGKAHHAELYRALKQAHPTLFAEIAEHRGHSDLSPLRKAVYPYVYGGRKRYAFESHIKKALDRSNIWTLRR